MKNFKKILIFLTIALLASGCNTIRKGFQPDKRSGEEFLVEKKSPLVIPPNYNKLPIPSQKKNDEIENKTDIKSLVLGPKNEDTSDKNSKAVGSIEKLILKEIKKN
tara:strand:+ start:1256 stop:1573 length:318 start_codon:yes stop_codon:yes gene_type:complete